ncbi:Zinc finger, RING/FYVE/PHD-type domain-containing protein [Strongyloides ratti]|uniref:Zinc finger, RING/FYVE/PHD-type domain-containing protein n=1 Tax=Strongyloides ratti TaxID=34506 RepID=A0A090LIA2_STRRB|nr:Zinc finger, RING/FYVE/PHD-type domain-containing protein [Strongyloides ratti]CEF69482.1 Zinc finger, RING/FYVE/PHD-type domain-containing protein [Strongyloides ratti]
MDSALDKQNRNKKIFYNRKNNIKQIIHNEPTPDELIRIVEEAERLEEEERLKNDELYAQRVALETCKDDSFKKHGPQLYDYLKVASHVTDRTKKSSKNAIDTKIVLNLCDLPSNTCLICTEEAKNPVGCLHCLQFLGCKNCVKKWGKVSNVEDCNNDGLRNLFISNDNHYRCFLCRAKWNKKCEEFCYFA